MTPAGAITLRDATAADAAAIARIYNQAVVGSTATFDTEPKTAGERETWLASHDASHPVIVALRDGRVVGWGSLSAMSDRPAWDLTAEISTYVDAAHVGTGVGSALGVALMGRAEAVGLHVVVSRVCAENEASIALATRLGFESVGTMREVGRKFDRWLDVVILQRRV